VALQIAAARAHCWRRSSTRLRSSGRTYEHRYMHLTETIRVNCTQWWVEATSFLAFESGAAIMPLVAECKKAIAPSHDVFLMREMDRQSAVICGKNDGQAIFKLMPYLKKV
jgi:hypothetical protein